MPGDFFFQKEHGLVVTRWRGDVTDADVLSIYEMLFAAPDFEGGLGLVVDVRRVQGLAITTGALTALDTRTKRRLAGAPFPTTVIAPADLPFGLSRMYAGLASNGPQVVHVFRTLEEAAEDLELAPETLDRLLASP